MSGRLRMFAGAASLVAAAVVGAGSLLAEASHNADNPKKHKAFFHLNEGDPQKAIAVLVNIQNYVDVVGWENIEALELVVHGPGLKPFVLKDLNPEVRGKLDTLLTGGLKVWACQITMRRQNIKPEELTEGLSPIPSGVVRVMELQEKGYAYIRP